MNCGDLIRVVKAVHFNHDRLNVQLKKGKRDMEYNRLHYKKGLHYESIRFADVVLCMNQLDVKRAVDQWGNGEYRYSRYEINDDQYNSEEIDFMKRYIRKNDSMRNVLLKIHI